MIIRDENLGAEWLIDSGNLIVAEGSILDDKLYGVVTSF